MGRKLPLVVHPGAFVERRIKFGPGILCRIAEDDQAIAFRVKDQGLVVPTHCTGWTAINAFAAAMPDRFVLNSVGTTFLFGQ